MMDYGKGAIFCGQSRAAAQGNPAVAITCTTPVQPKLDQSLAQRWGLSMKTILNHGAGDNCYPVKFSSCKLTML